MNLEQKQLQLQEDLVTKTIKEFEKKPPKNNSQKVIAKLTNNLGEYFSKLKIDTLLPIINKIIKEHSEEINSILEVDKKNIEKYIGRHLTKYLSKEEVSFDDFQAEFKADTLKEKNIKKLKEYIKSVFENGFTKFYEKYGKDADNKAGFLFYFVGSKELAFIVLHIILELFLNDNYDEDNKSATIQNVDDKIMEALFYSVETKIKNIEKYIEDKNKKTDTSIRKRNLEYISNLNDLDKKKIGSQIISILKEIEFIEYEKRDDNSVFIILSKKTQKEIKKLSTSYIVRFGVKYKPMIVPPRDWIDIDEGGFLKSENNHPQYNLLLIKAKTKQEKQKARNKKGQIPKEVLEAINNIQKTPFKINTKTLNVIKQLSKTIKLTKGKNYPNMKYYKSKINKTPKEIVEYKLAKLKKSLDTMIDVAIEFSEYEKIYFVWQIDFRGRVYPVQVLLHPQGGDVAKSMLLFANEKKLTPKGIEWFKIHGANMYGEVDKEPFEDRIKWIDSHKEDILKSAKDPINEDFWKQADEPFEFLAFCFEYEKYISNPHNFYTALPIAIDGSNNGLQHISTLLRDKDSARKVNVLPTDRVADIYKEVAKSTKDLLKQKYEKFLENKDNYISKDGLYFEEVEENIEDFRHLYLEIAQEIEEIDISTLNTGQYITSKLKRKDKIIKELNKIEKNILSRLSDYSLSKVKRRIISALKDEYYDFQEEKEDNKVIKEKNKYVKKVKKLKFVEESLISLLEKNFEIDRSFVKKPVMTDSYGSGSNGKKYKILEDLLDKEDFKKIDSKYVSSFALFLARVIEEAIEIESKSSQEYKKFMKKIASKILKTNHHIEWNTPLGLEVSQTEYKTKNEKLYLKDKPKGITIKIYTDKIDNNSHKKGIAPNFIHSLDATHLYMTINSLVKKGLSDFMTVHDSFATHANDVELLSKTLREEFINIYKKPILENFIKDVENRYNIKIDEKIPYIDDFDLDEILNSKYFFA